MKPQTAINEKGEEVILIHFLYSSPAGTTGADGAPLANRGKTWKIACMPNLFEFSSTASHRPVPHVRSDDPRAVTCPICQGTDAYKSAVARLFGGKR